MDSNELKEAIVGLQGISVQQEIEPYLSEGVKAFIPMLEMETELEDGTKLKTQYMGKTYHGEITEDRLKEFANILNDLAAAGYIEHGMLCPISKIQLMPPHSKFWKPMYLLIAYPFSRYELQELKERTKDIFNK